MSGANPTRWTAAAIAGVLLSITLVAPAAGTPPTPASGPVWDTGQLRYRWLSGSEPPTWMRSAIHAAAQDATVSTLADTPSFSYDGGGAGWIAYTGDIPTDYAVGYAVRNVPSSFGIRLRPQGYPLDWGTLRWCQFYDSPPSGCFDAELITLHEIGHVLTLGHIDESTVTDWNDTIMHAAPKTKAKTGWNAHEFGRCDAARLQLRYGAASPSERISSCLDLGTDLGLSASPGTFIDYGSNLTLSASLRIDADSPADILAGDPLSGRSVWLQRRPVGGSAWTDLVQMSSSAEAGRYFRTLNVTSPFEYRARFSASSSEGLDDATSSVIRISIDDPCVSSSDGHSINSPIC
ncbi:MAG TPA: hypothetical protein VEX62_06790 [Candidatus Limnocylindrales bacterium]|nr:hypothetical protein [Candidatus Limnocylindrales bacterium]